MREELWPHFGTERGHGEGHAQHAGLFVSLLVRYPEIGSVRYLPENETLAIGFTVRQELTDGEWSSFEKHLQLSLEVFSELSGRPIHVLQLRHVGYAPFTALEVIRDVQTLTQQELSVIVGTVSDRFGESLIYEPVGSDHDDDEPLLQDDLIEHLLDDVRMVPPPRRMIGFRDHGRVVVRGDEVDH